jgi:hypothetical protein
LELATKKKWSGKSKVLKKRVELGPSGDLYHYIPESLRSLKLTQKKKSYGAGDKYALLMNETIIKLYVQV